MRNNLKLFILFLVVNIALIPSAYSTISKSIDLIYWTPFSGGDARPMLNIVNAFNQSQMDINVRMKLFAWTKYYPELISAMESGKVPDIAIVHSSKLGEMASTGMISDINIIAKSAGIHWDDFSENTLKETIINDKHLAIPLDTHALIMFYNKTYLKKAGLLDKNENLLMKSGVEGFISFLKTLKKTLPKNVAPFGSPTNNDYPFWIWYALYSQIEGGGSYIVNGKAAFNNAPGPEGLRCIDCYERSRIVAGKDT